MTAREIAGLFADLELQLIESLRRNLGRHKAQERAEGGQGGVPERWAAWQAVKLRELNLYRRQNKAIMAEYKSRIDAETRAMLQEQFAEADGSEAAFFGVNGDKLDALIKEIQLSEEMAEKAALRYMDDIYRKTILRAAAALEAGGSTVQQATDLAVQDFLEQGITCIRYKNGRMINIASYAEMALRTSNTRAMLLGEAQKRERLGIDTVLVSQYGACSDTCLPWQGIVYIDDVWQPYRGAGRTAGGTYGYSRNGRSYPLLSAAVRAGLFHPNCRHTLITWIEGVSVRPQPMDKAKIEAASRLEEKQRRLERAVRTAKRREAGLSEPGAAKAARAEVWARQKALREFVEEHGDVLRRDPWRERLDIRGPYSTAADTALEDGTLYHVNAEAIQAVPRPFFQALGDRMNTQAQEYARGILRTVQGLPEGTEATVSFTLDGKAIARACGTAGQMQVKVQDLAAPYISLHNHASNGILSPEDIRSLIRHERMRGIGAVGNRGALYTCEKVFGYAQSTAEEWFESLKSKYPQYRDATQPEQALRQRRQFAEELRKDGAKYGLSFSA